MKKSEITAIQPNDFIFISGNLSEFIVQHRPWQIESHEFPQNYKKADFLLFTIIGC